jgi:hypothetical protein
MTGGHVRSGVERTFPLCPYLEGLMTKDDFYVSRFSYTENRRCCFDTYIDL